MIGGGDSELRPYKVVLVIDRSASMALTFPMLLEAVNRFMSNLRSEDLFALAVFDLSVKRLISWRSVRTGPKETVWLEAGGDTDFYRALDWASQELRKVRGRKAALFYTDGIDYRQSDIHRDARAFQRVPLYSTAGLRITLPRVNEIA